VREERGERRGERGEAREAGGRDARGESVRARERARERENHGEEPAQSRTCTTTALRPSICGARSEK